MSSRQETRRLEIVLAALFLASWLAVALEVLGLVSLSGSLPLSLYGYYAFAGALGWLAGNLYVRRARGLPRPLRRGMLARYLAGTPSLLYLVRAMAPMAAKLSAPFVPLYALAPFLMLFMVPVTLSRVGPKP